MEEPPVGEAWCKEILMGEMRVACFKQAIKAELIVGQIGPDTRNQARKEPCPGLASEGRRRVRCTKGDEKERQPCQNHLS